MDKNNYLTVLLMGFLGYLTGLFYRQMFIVLEGNLPIIISISIFVVGLMLLNLLIERIIPIAEYKYSHPLRLLSYAVFVIFVFLAVSI